MLHARQLRSWLGGVSMLAATFGLAPGAGAQDKPGDAAQTQRLEKLRAAGVKAPLTLLPVIVTERPSREVAEVLGLVLEKAGMEELAVSGAVVTLPEGTTWEQWPAVVGEVVRKDPPASGYVLLAEFVGTPQTGPKEVRFVIVDRDGALVLADRQTPADADFKKTAGADPDPMGCSVLVGERVRKLLNLPAASRKGEGKFAKLWAAKSRAPSAAEQTAMKKAQESFKKALRGSELAVFATLIGGTAHKDDAQHLAGALSKEFGCRAVVSETPFVADTKPSSNEQRRLWDLARAFRDRLRQSPLKSGYALVADYVLTPEGLPWTVHFVVCDAAGKWVVVDFQNNQWDDFKKVDPKSAADCDQLVVRRLRGYVD